MHSLYLCSVPSVERTNVQLRSPFLLVKIAMEFQCMPILSRPCPNILFSVIGLVIIAVSALAFIALNILLLMMQSPTSCSYNIVQFPYSRGAITS